MSGYGNVHYIEKVMINEQHYYKELVLFLYNRKVSLSYYIKNIRCTQFYLCKIGTWTNLRKANEKSLNYAEY